MARSILMQTLIDCENQLGWIPKRSRGASLNQARCSHHKVMTKAMARRGLTEEQVRLAYTYAFNRRQAINDPLELLGLIDTAKAHAAPALRNTQLGKSLTEQQADALAWEAMQEDAASAMWRSRIVRSVAAGLSETLADWAAHGRGEQAYPIIHLAAS